MRILRCVLVLCVFFGLNLNVLAGEKSEDARRWAGNGHTNAVANASLENDSNHIAIDVIRGTSAAAGPVLSVNYEFGRAEVFHGSAIRSDVTSGGKGFNCTEGKTREGYGSSVSQQFSPERHWSDSRRNIVNSFASSDVEGFIYEAIRKSVPFDIEVGRVSLPSVFWKIDRHDTCSRLHDRGSSQFSNHMCRREEVPAAVYEKSGTVNYQVKLSQNILSNAQDGNDRRLDAFDGVNEWVGLLSLQGQAQKDKKNEKEADPKKQTAPIPTSGVISVRNDGVRYGCIIAESSASEVNISCPQIRPPQQETQPKTSH